MPRPGQKILVTFYQSQLQAAQLLAPTRYVGSVLQTSYICISIYTHTVNCHWKVSPCFHRQKILTFIAFKRNVRKNTYHSDSFFSHQEARYSQSVTFWNYEVLRSLCNAIQSFFKGLFTRIKQETSLAFGSSPPSDCTSLAGKFKLRISWILCSSF